MSDQHTHTIHCDDPFAATNLRIEKSVDNHTPQVGDDVTWTIEIKNDGPGYAEAVRVEDLLPAGVYHVSDFASIGDYDEATGEWYVGTFAPGTCHTLTIVTTVTDTSEAQVNSATISSNTHDTNPYDNNDNDWIHATGPISDLKITKTVSNDQPALGEEVSWEVTVTNEGPDTATNVVVRDNLPSGVTHVSDAAANGEYDESAGTWRLDQLASGESQTLTIVTTVDESSAQWNSATAVSDTYESDWSDNTGHAVVRGGEADISITKTVSSETPNLGEQVEWTIVVTNNGADDAIGVKVLDTLPGGLQHLADDATTGFFDEYQGQWWIGELAAGATETLTISTNVIDAAEAQVNTSTVHTDTNDTNADNNVATASTDAEAADLAVVKTVSDPTPNVGDTITWTVVITNEGVDTAVNTVVHDALPNGVVYASDEATLGGYDNRTGQWDLGDLPSGASETLTIDTVVTDSFLQMNVAVATSDTFDPDDCNNADFAITDALPAADLSVIKSVSNEAPNVGDVVVWTIEVSNNGPDAASGIEVTDVLPAGVAYVPDAETNQQSAGSFDPATGIWTMATLTPGASETLEVSTTVTSLESQVNTVSVTSDTYDFNPDNNAADALTDAVAADVQVVKTVSDEAPNLGDVIVWTIEVTNNGPDTSDNIVIDEILPGGVSYIPFEFGRAGTAGEYDNEAGTWTLESLEVGATETLMLRTEVTSLDVQENSATATSSTVDLDETNNTDQASADPVGADLQISKVVSEESPELGEEVTWTLEVVNLGPDAATEVAVIDALPSGVEYVSSDTANGTVTVSDDGTLVWQIGDLAVDTPVTLEIVTEVTSLDIQVNEAVVTAAPGEELDTSNNTAEDQTDAIQVDLSVTNMADVDITTVGGTVVWTVTATNDGPDDATGVALSDLLPEGVEFVSADTNSGTYTDGVWTIGELPSGATSTVEVTTSVNEDATPGQLISIAEVIAQLESDVDSTPANDDGDQSEDDEAAATITVVEPEPVAGLLAEPNELSVAGSGDRAVNAVVVLDRSSSMGAEIEIDGQTETRLYWNARAIEEFAARQDVHAVKVLSFDRRVTDEANGTTTFFDGGEDGLGDKGNMPADEVSDWIDVTTPAGLAELQAFMATQEPHGSGTNYSAAIEATLAQVDTPPNAENETNFYFFSDGEPLNGGVPGTHQLLDVAGWEAHAEATYDSTYAIGYAGAVKVRESLEEIAHVNGEPDVRGVDDDPNVLLVNEVDAIPTVLSNLVSTSIKGNAIEDDSIMVDDFIISSMEFDGVLYTYDGTSVSGELTTATELPDNFGAESFIVVNTSQEGSLQFDFVTGDFIYYSPTTDQALTESFDYTITEVSDSPEPASSTSTVSINVTAPVTEVVSPDPVVLEEPVVSELISSSDDNVDQLLPALTSASKLPCADGSDDCPEDIRQEFYFAPNDIEVQIWDNGIAMF